MIIYMSRFLLVLTALMLTVSCGRNNFIEGVPVETVRAGQVLSLDRDTLFTCDFSECLQCVDLSVESDSVLVLREMENSSPDFRYFKCWSLTDFSYLGGYVFHGRGPGEVLMPDFIGGFVSGEGTRKVSGIADISLKKVFSVDFPLSAVSGEAVIRQTGRLPSNTMYVRPYGEARLYVECVDNDRLVCRLTDMDCNILKDFEVYGDIPAMSCAARLSHCLVVNQEKGLVASLMISLPQINILDLESGNISSYASGEEFRDWKEIIRPVNPNTAMDMKEYYLNADSSNDYIFALYAGVSRAELDGRDDTHLHVYDWSGRFLYDITLSEVIDAISFDEKTEMLYALDRNANRIYRYDMSELI